MSSFGHIFSLELWLVLFSNRRLAEALQVDPTVDPFSTKSSTCKYSDTLKEDARFVICLVINITVSTSSKCKKKKSVS